MAFRQCPGLWPRWPGRLADSVDHLGTMIVWSLVFLIMVVFGSCLVGTVIQRTSLERLAPWIFVYVLPIVLGGPS